MALLSPLASDAVGEGRGESAIFFVGVKRSTALAGQTCLFNSGSNTLAKGGGGVPELGSIWESWTTTKVSSVSMA